VKKEFLAADKDHSGGIDRKELEPLVLRILAATKKIGENFTEEHKKKAVDAVMKAVDEDKNGVLDGKEFGNAMRLAVLAIAGAFKSS